MSSSRRRRSVIELGHDAFLDIVANLVGILIILVVIMGAQSNAVVEAIKEEVKEQVQQDTVSTIAEPSDQQLATLEQDAVRAAAAQADSNRLEKMVRRYDQQIDQRQQQRALLLDLLSEAQAAWTAKQSELDQQTVANAKLQTELAVASEQLQRLQGERQRLENEPEPVVAVAHLPTPMAKTVFGDELHFRLKGNLLSVVPVDKLIEQIKLDFARAAPGSRDGELDGAVGPVRGYVARYVMDKERGMVNRGGQVQMATRIQLVGMTLEPLQEPHGQAMEKVLAGSSELDIELAGRDPATTTITVWVYPDSFAMFRQLKEHLYARGFATAARPLPLGHPISGSPQGSRSRAQ